MLGALSGSLLALADKPPPVDVSAHLDVATIVLWAVLGLALLFFAVRPELWRRLWLDRVDPRPAGLLRIVFGVVVLWTMVDLIPLGRFLFTDEGLWLPKMARRNYSSDFRTIWDPEHGFEGWFDVLRAFWHRFSLFHMRADPPFVWTIYGVTIVSLVMMILGIKTRITTFLSWFLVNTIYIYSPIFYSGGDTVVRVYLFLGLFLQWGQAYSLDAWWRRRRAVLRGAAEIPPLRPIPAWPLRLMMLQLAIIYCATGALKSGHTWLDGTALFFALNLDHFYRHPAQIQLVTFLQMIWVLPIATWITRIWETAFPVALVGVAVNAFERDKRAGAWPQAPLWRRSLSYGCLAAVFGGLAYIAALAAWYFYDPALGPWKINKYGAAILFGVLGVAIPVVALAAYLALRRWRPRVHRFVLTWLLGKRLWLGIGLIMHVGIDLLMNVGTFVQVMIAVYLAWLSGAELEAFWRYIVTEPQAPGEGTRPLRKPRWQAVLLAPIDRLRYRAAPAPYVVHHHPGEHAVRRAALLRMWDLSGRLAFTADEAVAPGQLCVVVPPRPRLSERLAARLSLGWLVPRLPAPAGARLVGARAGRALVRLLPGFWWMYPWCLVPGLSRLCGGWVARTFK